MGKLTAKPKSLTVSLTLDSNKRLAITLGELEQGWKDLKKLCPDHYLLFRDWARDLETPSNG